MAVIKLKWAALLGLGLMACASAQAADSCRLKGGDVVPLPAAACAKEGGTLIPQSLAPAAASAPAAAPVTLSANQKIAAAQQAVLNVLGLTVVNKDNTDMAPEGVVRGVSFVECKMKVVEEMQLDYGNLFSSRLHFNIISTVDFSAIDPKEYGLTGEVESAGGELKAHGVAFLEKSRKHGNHISIEVFRVKGKVSERYTLLGTNPYLSTPKLDLWVRDGYGYVPADDLGFADKSHIRVLYLVNTKEDADKLKQAFDSMTAACRQ